MPCLLCQARPVHTDSIGTLGIDSITTSRNDCVYRTLIVGRHFSIYQPPTCICTNICTVDDDDLCSAHEHTPQRRRTRTPVDEGLGNEDNFN